MGRHGPRLPRAPGCPRVPPRRRAGQRSVVEAVRQTADRLGNTPAVARRSYVHPAVLEAYVEGEIPRRRGAGARGGDEAAAGPAEQAGLADPVEEAEVVALLRRRLREDRQRDRAGGSR